MWWLIDILGGKPITPTGDHVLLNGNNLNESHETNGMRDVATKLEVNIIFLVLTFWL